jgi:tetratricopeptide (TPR) repeat protein
MFGLFKKEEFVCLGVNLEANWTNMESIFTAFELYEKLKDLAFLKEEILDLQKQLDINELGLIDVFNEFNWSSVKKDSVERLNSTKFIMMISGVRQEFAESKPHIELFKNHIEPSYLKSLASSPKKLDYNIEDVRMDYLKMGVVVPTHFDRLVIIEKEFREIKSGKILRCLSIGEKAEPLSLEPNSFEKLNIFIDKILAKLDNGESNIIDEENEILEVLEKNDELRDKYLEIKAYFILGISNLKIGQIEKAKKFFDTILNLETTISRNTIASDFIRPIGEFYEKNGSLNETLYWYKKAIEFSPAIGLKKRVKEIEEKLSN